MPPEQLTQLTWGARLRLERVAEGHRVVVSVPESVSNLTQARSILLKQGDVCVAEYVPRQPATLQRAEGVIKYAASLGVAHSNREMQFFEDELCALVERDESFATACLRAVHRALPVASAPDVQEAVADIPVLDGERLTDTQASQEAQLGEEGRPLSRHASDHPEQVVDRDVVASLSGHRDPAARRWKW